jgi:DNA-binding GntR family transcriptional regulator
MRLYGMDSPAGRQRQIVSVKEHYQLIDMASAGEIDSIARLITQHIRCWEPVFTAGLSERLERPLQSRAR